MGSRAAIEVGLVVGFAPVVRYVHPDKPRRGRWLSRSRSRCPRICRIATTFLISAFAVVAFSLIVQGLTAPFALKALGLTPKTRAARAGREAMD